MPWTGKSFAEKHNHGLSGKKAEHTAEVANAILRETGDEGKAIRIANAQAKRDGAPVHSPHEDANGPHKRSKKD